MYTQCPDCSTAFRVTADVLKMAAGKVRCGGCGNAFNALDYLSESMPERPAPRDADAALPELKPEPLPKDSGLPASISAEQSAALLKTLDELAGSNIRIEDTGVEWRVLDDDDVGEAASDSVANEEDADASPANDLRADDLGALSLDIDELLDESPTPVDQFLTNTPPQVDAPEIFEEPDDEPAKTSVDELRFDDNTPLPDDFDLDDESWFSRAPVAETVDQPAEPAKHIQAGLQADLDLSEPDEWTDILGEFEDLVDAVAAPAPLDAELDDLEALEEDEAEEPDLEPDEIESGPEEFERAPEGPEAVVSDIDELLDMDSQFALQAEAMGIDLSGMHESLKEPEVEEDVDLELLLEDSAEEDKDIEDLLDEDLVQEVDEDEFLEDGPYEEAEEAGKDEQREADADPGEPDENAQLALIDDAEDKFEDVEDVESSAAVYEFDIAPLTEEEQTINMQIDQDLLALAVQDKDGFASTIVIAEDAAESKAREKKKKKDKRAALDLTDTSAGFETIVMEGEDFSTGFDGDKQELNVAAAASLAAAAAAEREAEMAARTGGRRWGMIGGAVALVLLLSIQALHQSREALATIPAFNNVAGPLYRALGMPLQPDWDVTGWRFETTRSSVETTDAAETPSVDESDSSVVIFSRMGNNSDKPLPYPIIGISFTDRYEEPVGGFTLDPAEYLPDDLDPRKLVEPGNSFNAVMTIRSLSPDAESFRLRACYRNADGSLRCKDDGFK